MILRDRAALSHSPLHAGAWKENPQKQAIRRQKAHGESLRAWLHDRRIAAGKVLTKKRAAEAKARKGRRGVDRVPARYRVERPAPVYVAQHHDLPRDVRRARGITATSGNVPHTNPMRDVRSLRSGRLRKELRP